MESERTGDCHPLLLAAGELVGIMSRAVGKPHPGKKLSAFRFDIRKNLFLSALEVRLLLREKFLGKGDVLQGSVLGKQVEGLEYQSEVKAFFSNLAFLLSGRI